MRGKKFFAGVLAFVVSSALFCFLYVLYREITTRWRKDIANRYSILLSDSDHTLLIREQSLQSGDLAVLLSIEGITAGIFLDCDLSKVNADSLEHAIDVESLVFDGSLLPEGPMSVRGTSLVTLGLTSCRGVNQCFNLADFGEIRRLILSYSDISGDSLVAADLSSVETLHLDGISLPSEFLSKISTLCPRLAELSLEQSHLSVTEIESLTFCKALKVLNVAHTQIDEKLWKLNNQFTSLRILSVPVSACAESSEVEMKCFPSVKQVIIVGEGADVVSERLSAEYPMVLWLPANQLSQKRSDPSITESLR